jgi:hypothetical protein
MRIKLKSLREECFACPTYYTGETYDGIFLEAYLRNGFMEIKLNDIPIVECSPDHLDGICSFSDFKKYASINGYYINDSEATWSSQIEDTEKVIEELVKDKVWVKFIRNLDSESAGEKYLKGERYRATKDVANALVKYGYAEIV